MTALLLVILAAIIGIGAWIVVREQSAIIDAQVARALRELDLDEDEQ